MCLFIKCLSISFWYRLSVQRGTVIQTSEYPVKEQYIRMVNMKSGCLTPKGLDFLSLTAGDLEND